MIDYSDNNKYKIVMSLKFFTSLVAAATMLAFVSCQNGPAGGGDNPEVEGEGVSCFMATIATPELSRAQLEASNTPTWKAGDNMLVLSYNGSTITNFKSTIDPSTIEGSSAYFKAASGRTITKQRETYSVYPYFQPKSADVAGGREGSRTFKFSLEPQSPSFDSKLNLPLLVGVWDDATESFTMNNPLLTVKLHIVLPENEEDMTLRRINISGNNGETLWGTAATFTTSDMRVKFAEEGAVKSFSLDCSGQVLGAAGKSISFCIPAAEYA